MRVKAIIPFCITMRSSVGKVKMNYQSLALHTDFYQITMAACYHANSMNKTAGFSLFAHNLPDKRGYMVAAGLEYALDYLENFCFTDQDIAYLDSLERFTPDFLDYLSKVRFTGEVWALPEGTVCRAGEPLLEVTAPLIEAQLVETFLVNTLNLHTTLTSKAARCVQAANGRALLDFGLRRTQGPDAGMSAARSSAIAGFAGTSNVAAAQVLGTMPAGTMAHSFIEAFGDEEKAFKAFAESFPKQGVFLVDTYDTVAGLKHAMECAKQLEKNGQKLLGVRIDSGDLVAGTRQAREMLDKAGFEDAAVVVSGSLDEIRIQELINQGAQIDMMGVGTKMACSADAPFLDLVYKLVKYDNRPTLKLCTGKETWVENKQIWRQTDEQGIITHDLLGLRTENNPGRPMLAQVMANGKVTHKEDWRAAHERFKEEVKTLPAPCLDIPQPESYELKITPSLKNLQQKTKDEALSRCLG